jgi:hypothetical protein
MTQMSPAPSRPALVLVEGPRSVSVRGSARLSPYDCFCGDGVCSDDEIARSCPADCVCREGTCPRDLDAACQTDCGGGPLSSRCGKDVACTTDAGSVGLDFSAAACRALSTGCPSSATKIPPDVDNAIWSRCLTESGIPSYCLPVYFDVDGAGCPTRFELRRPEDRGGGAFFDCVVRSLSAYRWPCVAGMKARLYHSCTIQ